MEIQNSPEIEILLKGIVVSGDKKEELKQQFFNTCKKPNKVIKEKLNTRCAQNK